MIRFAQNLIDLRDLRGIGLAILTAVAFAFDPALSAKCSAHPVTAKTVDAMIAKYGATQAVAKLHRGESAATGSFGEFDQVLDGVSAGDSQWLRLVPKLKERTDAAASESLEISVADALPKNPVAVLRLIKSHPEWREACTYPFIEPTTEENRKYFRVTIPAVAKVRDPQLRSVKNACLANLKRAQHTP
jgi:hypothetical protein